jgi:hypothetical protein
MAVAAERYRRDCNALPGDLGQLVPKYLDRVLRDPFSNGVLRLKVIPGSIIIYSVGPDLTDDGGKLSKDLIDKGHDLGIQLWAVAARRTAAGGRQDDEQTIPDKWGNSLEFSRDPSRTRK